MTKTTESKWRALIVEQESSGQTVRAFAASRGEAAGTVFWWRIRLRRRAADAMTLVPVEVEEAVVFASLLKEKTRQLRCRAYGPQ
jgi:hypothetical protein